ncbi:thiol-disulfide isomerase or thioredoxin [Candidatus Mancarchaeum acidiphilum]|uniref:Thiol-disulfide isomerase or thioredoxin n=1 Tax=Candidatus Mancarchaeum acidiphilum TaxID=1920749 RepID=A0A218NNR0_9ARCH|nr:thioredoxin family protein [Candidatus Mancarchaeum acidiphilum]ASI14084.1 thiol-disulfide isomerase or thioredoxin [Candidatus Mancarchaeum acidiphilum]
MVKLKDDDKKAITEKFSKELKGDVNIMYFYDSDKKVCPYCSEMTELLEDLVGLSPKLKLTKYNAADESTEKERKFLKINDQVPALVLGGKKIYNLYYFGIPAGYEFASLLEDIVDVSNGTTRLSEKTKAELKEVSKPIDIKVFVTPTCPWCPRAVRTAHQLAIENPMITSSMIEASEFEEMSTKYKVMAVPRIVINDKSYFEGAQPEQVFMEYIKEELKDEAK